MIPSIPGQPLFPAMLSSALPKQRLKSKKNILVLGVGNALMSDDGIGIHVINELKRCYEFPSSIWLVDGGTAGINLLDYLCWADYALIIDAVVTGATPGTIHHLTGKDIGTMIKVKGSMHQLNLSETLACARMLDMLPDTRIIGIEPADYSHSGTSLSKELDAKLEELVKIIISEIAAIQVDDANPVD